MDSFARTVGCRQCGREGFACWRSGETATRSTAWRTYYLPPAEAGGVVVFGRSLVDLRFIVTLDRELFDRLERVVALTRTALLDLYMRWTSHATGKRIPTSFPCQHCGEQIELLRAVEDRLRPDADY